MVKKINVINRNIRQCEIKSINNKHILKTKKINNTIINTKKKKNQFNKMPLNKPKIDYCINIDNMFFDDLDNIMKGWKEK